MSDPFSQCVPIPSEYVPYIIGKGGRTITNIEKGSHTSICITEDRYNKEWHYVKITGGTRSIDKARKWIIKCLISAIETKKNESKS